MKVRGTALQDDVYRQLSQRPEGPHGVSRRAFLAGTAVLVGTVVAARTVAAQTGTNHKIQMLNKGSNGQAMQFEPAFLKISPGDTVTFVPTDKGHNSESILEMLPEGSEPWKGKINEETTVAFNQEGVFGYKCLPHFALGMVGIIQVDESVAGLEKAQTAKLPGKAKTRMQELVAEAGGGAAAPAN